ncbi:hypothetical protein KDI_31890 [Dictyobacter arantiisoli]|uniref:Uncharacterized protein n=1 Tax=Dictyobacter arantiisoli TaxID=2014874 RepID=A0A5A5TEG5_9CHLR|nr:hypothetical protein KDI_31890 [Dictyobacter arantiisoli]
MTQHLVRFGIYHIDHTRRPKPLTYQVSFDPEKAQEEKEEANRSVRRRSWSGFAPSYPSCVPSSMLTNLSGEHR